MIKGIAFDKLNDIGIFPQNSVTGFLNEGVRRRVMAGDAALVTQANNGVPLWMLTYFDPMVIEILTAPLRAEKIFAPQRKGDWTTPIMQFNLIEHTGDIEPYGDFTEGGSTDINVNYPTRQSFPFQTMARWGDRQIDEYGKAKINYHSQKEIAAAKTIKIAHNTCWFYGVQGLKCYGILNDPDLLPSISPIPFAPSGGGTPVLTWADKAEDVDGGAQAIYNDVRAMYTQMSTQTQGIVSMDDPMKLVVSNTSNTFLATKSKYNVSVKESLREAFPNLEIVTAPEYSTDAGEFAQLIADSVEGIPTGILAYTELERSHGVVRKVSSYKEKKSAGTWGSVIFRPMGIVGMLGI